jgi:hypothetical protein
MQFDRRFSSTRGERRERQHAFETRILAAPRRAELRRTIYDCDAAARTIEASDYPQAKEFAAMNVLSPTPEAEMLERMTAVASAAAPRS